MSFYVGLIFFAIVVVGIPMAISYLVAKGYADELPEDEQEEFWKNYMEHLEGGEL